MIYKRNTGKLHIPTSLFLPMIFGLVFAGSCTPQQDIFPPPAVSVSAAVPQSPYAQALNQCLYGSTRRESCPLNQLPYIGQDSKNAIPTVDEVMAHVAVSRPWMGNRFRQLLMAWPDHMRTLLKSVTAIVIAEDNAHPGYYPFTGAVYLDAQYLWLTQDEKATLAKRGVKSQNNAEALPWARLWRYVKNKSYAYKDDGLTSTQTRTLNDIIYINAALMYHVIAFAADVVPPEMAVNISLDKTPIEVTNANRSDRIADKMTSQFPLQSNLLKNLGPVFANQKIATGDQTNLPLNQIISEFSADPAVDINSYTDPEEDMAFIFEEFMMFYNFGVDRDIALAPRPATPDSSGNSYLVTFGQRRRIADAVLREKVKFVVQQVFPSWAASVDFSKLGNPIPMNTNQSWITNLAIGP